MKRGIDTIKAVLPVSAMTDRGRLCGEQVFGPQPWGRGFRLVSLVLGLCLSQSVAALSLYDIIELSRNGYGEDEIARLIAVTETRFDLDVDSLRTLTAAGVSEPVIREMLQAGDHLLSGGQRVRSVSEVRTNAHDRSDGVLANTTINDVLQLYSAGLSEVTLLSFVRHRNECVPFSVDHLLQMAEAGMSEVFVSAMDSLVDDCRDEERITESRPDFYIASSRTTRAYVPFMYENFYYRARLYPLVIDLDRRQPQSHQGHLIETQGAAQEVIHHVLSDKDVIDHHHHEIVRDHGRVEVRDFSEHQHVGVSLTEHEAVHPEHSTGVSVDSRVTRRVNDYANRSPRVTSSSFSMVNRSTRSGSARLGSQPLVSRSHSSSANSLSTRGGGIARSASSRLSVGNQRARSGSMVFSSRSSISPGRPANASNGIGRAAPRGAVNRPQPQRGTRVAVAPNRR